MIELQGQIFFGNATTLCADITHILQEANGEIWYLLLDFTLVLGIDCSAAESLAKINSICKSHHANLCYSRGSRKGFPTDAPLSEELLRLEKDTVAESNKAAALSVEERRLVHVIHVADGLDEALEWCEDDLIFRFACFSDGATKYANYRPFGAVAPSANAIANGGQLQISRLDTSDLNLFYLRQLHLHCPNEDMDTMERMLRYFEKAFIAQGTVLWRQEDESDRAVFISSGSVVSSITGEEERTREEVSAGFMIGEFGLLTGTSRRSTVVALEDCHVLLLRKERLEKMMAENAYLVVVLSRVCMVRYWTNPLIAVIPLVVRIFKAKV